MFVLERVQVAPQSSDSSWNWARSVVFSRHSVRATAKILPFPKQTAEGSVGQSDFGSPDSMTRCFQVAPLSLLVSVPHEFCPSSL